MRHLIPNPLKRNRLSVRMKMVSLKFLVLCIGFFAINMKSARAVTDQEKKEVLALMTLHIVECSSEFDINEDLLKGLKKSGDFSEIEPCFLACVMKKVGLFDSEGKYDGDKAKEIAAKYVSSEEEQKKIGDVIDTCTEVNDKEVSDGAKGCERAKLIFECMAPHRNLFWSR